MNYFDMTKDQLINELLEKDKQIERDLFERKKAEETLIRLADERFCKAFNFNPAAMTISTINIDEIIYVNKCFLDRHGYTRDEVIGRSAVDLGFWFDLSERDKFIGEIKKKGYAKNHEVKFYNKSSDVITALASGVVIDKDCVLIASNDITELRHYQKEMARLDRLNLIGEIAAGIGHEIRNPMTTVRGLLQLFINKDKFSSEKKCFELMISELDRANEIITEFLSLSKNKAVEQRVQNLNSIIRAISPLLTADSAVADKHIVLELFDIPDIPLDEKEIRQLVFNMVRNGLEAMEPGGTLTIKTCTEGSELVLSVRDQGRGIKKAVLDKIGTPFLTTKENGTGLGLAICFSIADRHNAKINVETGPAGTTFYVRFKI
ncbi:ATP-binding protein [Pelotomaculum propionicicum]|uniref:ATP-binding protein n=1 Tax=Pelotomaculum propionicicum TaxID=258475 RepID=UPI003B7607A1